MKKRVNPRIITAQFDSCVVRAKDYLGIDPQEIWPITDFFDDNSDPCFDEPVQIDGRPSWVDKLLTTTAKVVEAEGLSIVVVELSVLSEQSAAYPRLGGPFFTANIICPGASATAEGEAAVLKAYQSALSAISHEGTIMNTPEFHELHYVHVCGRGLRIGGALSRRSANPICARRRVEAKQLDKKYREWNQEIDFKEHHAAFFQQFVEAMELRNSGNRHDLLHYVALPFQRPEHLTGITEAVPVTRLEPAGALFLILEATARNAKTKDSERQIAAIASKLQRICTLSSLKATSQFADIGSFEASARLRAYDGVGHALRAFVEATKYEGVIGLLSHVQRDPRLPEDLIKELGYVRRSLRFFEHAEALGSLMRLHGWLDAPIRGFGKVIECFDEAQVKAIKEGKLGADAIVLGAIRIVKSLARALAYKDEVDFRISHKDSKAVAVESVMVSHSSPEPEELEERSVPPLTTGGDRRAVLLAATVAILEPLRNASMYVKDAEPASPIEVIVEGGRYGAFTVYVGNRWYQAGSFDEDATKLSTGIELVQQLLQDCHLGHFFRVNSEDLRLRKLLPKDLELGSDPFVWIAVTIDPISLYDFAKGAT